MSEPVLLSDNRIPPFSLLRKHPSPLQCFDAHPHLILHAPPGTGKRTTLLQWLYRQHQPFGWICWSRVPPTDAEFSTPPSVCRVQDVAELRIAVSAQLEQPATRCLVVEDRSTDGSCLPWRELISAIGARHSTIRLFLLTSRLPAAVSTTLPWSAHVLHFDTLTFSTQEVESVAQLVCAGKVPARWCGALYTATLGWPAALFQLLRNLPALAAPACSELGCMQVSRWLRLQDFPRPASLLELLALLQKPGALPDAIFAAGAPLAHLHNSLALARQWGYVHCVRDSDNRIRVHGTGFARLTLTHFPAPPPTSATLIACAEWLMQQRYSQAAIDMLVQAAQWQRVEDWLLQEGDVLIAQLQVNAVAQWIQTLDLARPIRNPLLLLKAIRCAVYRGDLPAVEQFFSRILILLETQDSAVLQASMPEAQWERLVAEVALYSRMLNRGDAICRRLMDLTTEVWRGADPWTLLREAYQAADAGQILRALPMLSTGLDKAESLDSPSLYLVFANQYCWAQVLSGEMDLAERFLQQVKQWLMHKRIVFMGAYDWLDLLELLLARVRGELADLAPRVAQLLQKPEFTQDFLKHYLLINLQAELALTRGELYVARQAISKLGLLKQGCSARSYWFPSVEVLHRALRRVDEGDDLDLTPLLPHTEMQAADTGSLQQQTGCLWDIKMRLHRRQYTGVLASLEMLAVLCGQSGQWLRLYEIDVLRAVYFYRNGDKPRGETLFRTAMQQIESHRLAGILLDPFLLWQDFVRGETDLPGRDRLIRLYQQARPLEDFNPDRLQQAGLRVPLSRRERDVLALLVQGLGNQDIADTLHVSITTVRTHVRNLYRKLDVYNRTGATRKALQFKLV